MKPDFFRRRSVFAVVLLAGAFATLALAHNKLLKSAPAAGAALNASPARVEMWFAEKPDLTVSKIAVKGPAGAVETGPAHANAETSIVADFKGKLADGRYIVSWQTAGDDGHMSKGEFSFSVKSAR
ncbi:MAG: copper resistance protein CopC [Bryobacteraceae bacterium]|jgi:methionine-rich copper-binding protein CopC